MSQFPTLCVVNYDDDLPRRKFRYSSSSPKSSSRDVSTTLSQYDVPYYSSSVTRTETTVPYRLSARTNSSSLQIPKEARSRSHVSFFRDNETTQSQPVPYEWYIRDVKERLDRARTAQSSYSLPSLRSGWGDTSHTVNAEVLDEPVWNKYLNAWVSGKQDDGDGLYCKISQGANLYDRGLYHYVPQFEEFPHLPCARFHAHMTRTPAPRQDQNRKKKVIKRPEFWHYKRKEEPPKPKPKRKASKGVRWLDDDADVYLPTSGVLQNSISNPSDKGTAAPPKKPPEPIRLPTPLKSPPPPPPPEESDEREEEIPPDIKYSNDFMFDIVNAFIPEELEILSIEIIDSLEDGLEDGDDISDYGYLGDEDFNIEDAVRVYSPITRMEPPPTPPQKLQPPPKSPTPPPTSPPKEPTPPPLPPPKEPKKKKVIVKKEKKPIEKPPPKTPTPPPPKEPTPPPPPPPLPTPPPLPPPPDLPPLPIVEKPKVRFKEPVKKTMDLPKIESPPPSPSPPVSEPEEEPKRKKVTWNKNRSKLMYDKMRRRKKPIPPPPKTEVAFKDYGWLAQFCILKKEKVEMYRRAFETLDDDEDGYLDGFETIMALKGISGANTLTEMEEEYIYRILEMAEYHITSGTDFRIFAIVAALTQKIARLDNWMKNIINRLDFKMLEMKMFKSKDLFLWNVDQNTNTISIEQLMIELKAGGVSEEHQEEVQVKLGHLGRLDLLDFMTYVPLFIMLHESVVENPLDDSRDK
uniref:Titin-like n=1 Tax=Saccoglossus kowalevskii TaxID=10224 RepID=A0ABM0M1A3_SACKO|nr:PREDICTED: titin-like [Saccoglossus kowalevskii]